MTASTREIEKKFNESLPKIDSATSLGEAQKRKFNKADFLKAAEELKKVIKENDAQEPTKS